MAAIDDDDKPKKKIAHEIGQDLSLLSVEELAERVQLLRDEIARLEADMSAKARHALGRRSVFQAVMPVARAAAQKSGIAPQFGNLSLSFLDHYCESSIFMDIEWLLSTLFDASLLSTSSRRQRRLLFLSRFGTARGRYGAALLSLPGNYVAKFALRSGQARAARDAYPSSRGA